MPTFGGRTIEEQRAWLAAVRLATKLRAMTFAERKAWRVAQRTAKGG
jgi:hypothetical protein